MLSDQSLFPYDKHQDAHQNVVVLIRWKELTLTVFFKQWKYICLMEIVRIIIINAFYWSEANLLWKMLNVSFFQVLKQVLQNFNKIFDECIYYKYISLKNNCLSYDALIDRYYLLFLKWQVLTLLRQVTYQCVVKDLNLLNTLLYI